MQHFCDRISAGAVSSSSSSVCLPVCLSSSPETERRCFGHCRAAVSAGRSDPAGTAENWATSAATPPRWRAPRRPSSLLSVGEESAGSLRGRFPHPVSLPSSIERLSRECHCFQCNCVPASSSCRLKCLNHSVFFVLATVYRHMFLVIESARSAGS